jgi:putative membrane fusion protein
MKRTDRLSNFIAILLFLAFAVYAGAYAIRSLRDTTVTAQAVAADVSLGGPASGIVIREETVLTSGEKYIDVTARDGAKIAVGAALATAMRSETGLERANRIHELELEISRMSDALDELDSAADLTTRDESLRTVVRKLSGDVARHELSSLDTDSLNLRSLLFSNSASGASKAELRALQRELDSLQNSSSSDATVLTAEHAGVFSTLIDGYEALTPADLEDLTPEALAALTDYEPDKPAGAYGKLVTSYRWYFAAAMSVSDAENLTVGKTATLNFGRYYGADISARVISISEPVDGTVAAVFRCDTALADTLAMRCVPANVVFATYSGIRVPAEAVQKDKDGQTYVWCVTAMQLERKDVEVLYADGDFAVLAPDVTADALRDGNTVVVSGQDLYEGKIME